MFYAGLDVGTTGAKITLFEDEAELMSFYRAYPNERNAEKDEIDADLIASSCLQVIQEALSFCPELGHIGVTTFGEAFVMLGEDDAPLSPIILYSDGRGKRIAEEIRNSPQKDLVEQTTGLLIHEMFSLPKLLHIRQSRPELFRKAKKILLIQDFIIYRLTGARQIDESLASRTMLFDIHKKAWSEELFAAFALDMDLFSKPVPSGSYAGIMKGTDVKIYNGSHDQVSVALGSGIAQEGWAADGMGTCDCLIPFINGDRDARPFCRYGFGLIPYLFSSSYVCYPLIFSGGALVEWFMKIFAKEKEGHDFFDGSLNPNTPSPVLAIPHFLGSGTPSMNSGSKGMLEGLTVSSTREEIYQGILEGIGYEMLLNIRLLEENGVPVTHVFASGGGSKNRGWLQIKANILNLPVTRIANPNAGTIGTAIMVGTSIGVFPNLKEGMARLVKQEETYYPDEKAHALYEKRFEQYKRLLERKETYDDESLSRP